MRRTEAFIESAKEVSELRGVVEDVEIMKLDLSRRQLLRSSVATCLLPAFAGCNEADSGPQPEIELLESTIITDNEGEKWIRSESKNTTEVDHGRLRVNHSTLLCRGLLVSSQQ